MSESRQVNLIRICDPLERRFLEDSHSGSPEKQDLQHTAAVRRRRSMLHLGRDDNGDPKQRLPPFCQSKGFAKGSLSYQWYEYEPLPASRWIRLLEIQRESPHKNTLRCRMINTSMACLPRYDALSYAWGTAKETENLECNGQVIKVRRNLMHALRRLHYRNDVGWLWVDAICINQQNKEEKDEQIPLMPDIYRMAQSVIVWIGEDGRAEAKAAFGIVKRLALDENTTLDALLHHPSRYLLSTFYRQRWFSRVWIIQEVAMADNVEVLWGAEKVSWEHVCRATAMIRTFRGRMIWHTPLPEVDNAYMLYKLPKRDGLPLLYWLEASRNFDSTNTKDRVYSLLGLANIAGVEDDALTIRPDHRKKHGPCSNKLLLCP